MMIERIRREHGYMVRLLAVLKQKIAMLEQEQQINYSLLREIVTYLADHSERVHHPKEDIIYQYYLDKFGQQQDIENLELEHKTLSTQTHAFLDTVDMILNDAIVPQDIFISQLKEFVYSQRRHLEMEEQSILPLITRSFTVKDWQAVEDMWSVNEDDPVFGDTIAEQYQQLAKRVRQDAQECV
ncbi:hemerythrin domain-containing protein [Vibrio hepatarius]|jgi:hemerythrin-like domain-containing protein|uniref:Cation-binding protein n=1 Tax=Vibrio hepatarius TaxID=171383 RepID=A0A0M0I088_9VIBR|nr:hemerythrin domain-containing protein [Vibrio hepatarius]KOO07754.1 cation-binding protein [Vibrio hepatarius]